MSVGGSLPEDILESYRKAHPPTQYESQPVVEAGKSNTELLVPDGEGVVDPASSHLLVPPPSGVEPRSPQPSSTVLIPQIVGVSSLSVLSTGSDGTNPVTSSLAKYLGIDLSPDGKMAELRRGIILVLHGPPLCGKTTQATALGTRYQAPVLTIDGIVKEAISTAHTTAGGRARGVCIEAAASEPAAVPVADTGTETPVASKASIGGRRTSKPCTLKDSKEPESLKEYFSVEPLVDSEHPVPSGTLPAAKLPEEVVTDIVSDRLLHSDCRHGAIFDGLVSPFTGDAITSAAVLMKAAANRQHIYCVHLELDYSTIKERELNIEVEEQRKKGKRLLSLFYS